MRHISEVLAKVMQALENRDKPRIVDMHPIASKEDHDDGMRGIWLKMKQSGGDVPDDMIKKHNL